MGTDQERRTLLAIVLSLGVYFLWMAFLAPKPPPPGAKPAPAAASAPEPSPTAPVPEAEAAPATESIADHSLPLGDEGWKGEVSSRNGAVRDLVLHDFKGAFEVSPIWTWLFGKAAGMSRSEWTPYTEGPAEQRVLTGEGALVLAGAGELADDGAGGPGDASAYRVEQVDRAIRAVRVLPGGLSVEKRYTPGESPYTIDVEVTFRNPAGASAADLWVGVGERMAGTGAGRFTNAIRPLLCVDSGVEHVYETEELVVGERESWSGPVNWFGMGDRYFMSVLVPVDPTTAEVVVDDLPGGRVGAFLRDPVPLPAGEARTHRFTAYVGPKNLDLLKPVGHELDRAVELGWFGFFARILLFLLKVFEKGVANWGIAIMLLTLLVKIVFFPLTQKAFASGKRMQALQPKLNEIREKYKDNRELQTQETMKLFKEHEVNPMGGCLPTLVQLPVWIALYNVMLHAVELYNSSFLYLKDLTEPDPYGVLPTIYAALMVAQQRMMPMTGMDETQQKMLKMMPLVFAFFMYSFPSGLVLYFSINMILTILQQWLVQRTVKPIPASA